MKTKIRLNWVDGVILMLAALLIGTAVWLRNRSAGNRSETRPMRYTIQLQGVSRELTEQPQKGDKIYRSTNGTVLGTLTDVRREAHQEYSYSEKEKQFISTSLKDSWDLFLTVEGDGTETETELLIEGETIRVGIPMEVKGKNYAGRGFVVLLDDIGETRTENPAEGKGDSTMEYAIRFSGNRRYFTDELHPGDKVYDQLTGALLGTITDVLIQPQEVLEKGDGKAFYVEHPLYYTTTVWLTAQGTDTEKGFFLDGKCEMRIGSGGTALTKFATGMYEFCAIAKP